MTGDGTKTMEVLVGIEITPKLAQMIRFLGESGVFDIQDGSAELHFKDGQLRTIKRQLMSYAHVDK